ncbi:MAG: folate family ECF transporter S component [Cellulosilyticaceae bacterium]
MKFNTKQLVYMAFLIALNIVMTRFFVIYVGPSRISFTFVAIAMMAVYYGPITTGIGCGIADIIGTVLFPAGPFFPGYTLSAVVTGMVYGLFLYKKRFSWWRIIIIQSILLVVITIGMNTIWAMMITGKGYMVLLPTRIMTAMIRVPIEIVILGMVQQYVVPHMKKHIVV